MNAGQNGSEERFYIERNDEKVPSANTVKVLKMRYI